AVSEIEAFDHPHLLEQAHGTIDGGQIAFLPGQRAKNLLRGHRVILAAEEFEEGLARAGDFARLAAQSLGQARQRGVAGRMRVKDGVHELKCSDKLNMARPIPTTMAASLARLNR